MTIALGLMSLCYIPVVVVVVVVVVFVVFMPKIRTSQRRWNRGFTKSLHKMCVILVFKLKLFLQSKNKHF